MEERNCPMEDPFAFLTLNFLKKSEIFPGSLGTFRYRFQRTGKVNDGTVQAWVYENICFEKAQHIETETFPWTEEGMASLRSWLNERLRERGSELFVAARRHAKRQHNGQRKSDHAFHGLQLLSVVDT